MCAWFLCFKKGVPGLQGENPEDEHHCLSHQLARLQLNPRNPLENGNLAIRMCPSCSSKLVLVLDFNPDFVLCGVCSDLS